MYRVSVISDICRKSDPITNEPRIERTIKSGVNFRLIIREIGEAILSRIEKQLSIHDTYFSRKIPLRSV